MKTNDSRNSKSGSTGKSYEPKFWIKLIVTINGYMIWGVYMNLIQIQVDDSAGTWEARSDFNFNL